MTESPCTHALGLSVSKGFPVASLLSRHQSVKFWKEQWANTPIARDLSPGWCFEPRLPLLEALAPNPSGAPKKHKRMSSVASDYIMKRRKHRKEREPPPISS